MCKIAYFVYCDSILPIPVSPHQNFVFQLTNPLSILFPMCMPSGFSFSVSFAVMGVDTTVSDSTIRVDFCDPNEKVIHSSGELNVPKDEMMQKGLPIEYRGFSANMDLRNVFLEMEGEYASHVYLNNTLLGKYVIYVMKKPATGDVWQMN